MNAAEAIFFCASVWLSIGAIVSVFFLTVGIDRIDEDARGAYAFRPLLVPACLLIWPLILWRWIVLETDRDQWQERHRPPRAAHFLVSVALALLIPLIIFVGVSAKQIWPGDFVPERISPPQEQQQ